MDVDSPESRGSVESLCWCQCSRPSDLRENGEDISRSQIVNFRFTTKTNRSPEQYFRGDHARTIQRRATPHSLAGD